MIKVEPPFDIEKFDYMQAAAKEAFESVFHLNDVMMDSFGSDKSTWPQEVYVYIESAMADIEKIDLMVQYCAKLRDDKVQHLAMSGQSALLMSADTAD